MTTKIPTEKVIARVEKPTVETARKIATARHLPLSYVVRQALREYCERETRTAQGEQS